MHLLIFGASGGTGRALVRRALAQGHTVTAFVRDPARFDLEHARLRVAPGVVQDAAAVVRAVGGQDAVLSALGARTPLRRDPALVDGVRNIVVAMARARVRRFIYLSFLGVRDGRGQLGPLLGLVAPVMLRHPVADHELKERIIMESDLDWTIVRPPRLTFGPHTGAYRSGERVAARSIVPTISRADVADFMLRQLSDPTYVRRAPGVMY